MKNEMDEFLFLGKYVNASRLFRFPSCSLVKPKVKGNKSKENKAEII